VSIGKVLATARGQAGLTITQVSQRTRIRETIIGGIERDDFSACGGDFYARGHIRAIARAVGVDGEPLVGEYDSSHGTPQASPEAGPPGPSAPPRPRQRHRPNGSVALLVVLAAVLVVLYYVLPLDRRWDSDTAVRLLVGLLLFAGVVVCGVRFIAGSRYPGVRAAEAVALVIPFFLLLFASTYFVMERASAASFSQPLTRTDALYFTVTVFSMVGFGDITAKSEAPRVVLIV
jgi:hypothetical protein